MKMQYSIPKVSKTTHLWFVHFRYEGKQFRYRFNLNNIDDLKERALEFSYLCQGIHNELKKGWNPNIKKNRDEEQEKKIPLNSFNKKEIEKIVDIRLLNIINKSKNNTTPIVKTNPKNENIFCNNGFVLFDYILTEHIKPKGISGRYEDLSYYYRRLFEDGFIHQKSEPFREWFFKEYQDEFSKIKTKYLVENKDRKIHYSNALDWFKTQNL